MLACLLCRKLWVHPPVLNKQVVVPDAQDPNIRKMDTGLEFQGQCQVHTNFKASLGYMTTCLKNKPKQREKDKPSSHACRGSKNGNFLGRVIGTLPGIRKDPEWKMGLEFSSAHWSHERGQTGTDGEGARFGG